MTTLPLLPEPKQLSLKDGGFSLNANTTILIPALAGDEAFFAALQIQDEVCHVLGLRLPICRCHQRRKV